MASTSLGRQVRKTAKSGANINGTVVDIFGETASVKLSSNGALMRNLKVMGGPVKLGQLVEVNFQSSPPVIVAYSTPGITQKSIDNTVDSARTPFIMSPVAAAGSGGHVIIDYNNTAYPQEDNLKIVGHPTDIVAIADSTGDSATVVTVYALKIYHNSAFVAYAVSINFIDDGA